MEQTGLDLATYMSGSISRIMAKAYKNVLSNPREAKFAFRMQQLFAKSEKRRKKVQEKESIDVPLSSLAVSQQHVICIAKAVMLAVMVLLTTRKRNVGQR